MTSTRPCSPISTLMQNVKNDITIHPKNPPQKPYTTKPGTNADASMNMSAFTTSTKKPSVTIDSGSVSSSTTGRTTALTIPIAAAAASSAPKLWIAIPDTILSVSQSAIAETIQRTMSPAMGAQ